MYFFKRIVLAMLGKIFYRQAFFCTVSSQYYRQKQKCFPRRIQQASSTTSSFPCCLAHVSPLLMCFVFEYICPPAVCHLQEVQDLYPFVSCSSRMEEINPSLFSQL